MVGERTHAALIMLVGSVLAQSDQISRAMATPVPVTTLPTTSSTAPPSRPTSSAPTPARSAQTSSSTSSTSSSTSTTTTTTAEDPSTTVTAHLDAFPSTPCSSFVHIFTVTEEGLPCTTQRAGDRCEPDLDDNPPITEAATLFGTTRDEQVFSTGFISFWERQSGLFSNGNATLQEVLQSVQSVQSATDPATTGTLQRIVRVGYRPKSPVKLASWIAATGAVKGLEYDYTLCDCLSRVTVVDGWYGYVPTDSMDSSSRCPGEFNGGTTTTATPHVLDDGTSSDHSGKARLPSAAIALGGLSVVALLLSAAVLIISRVSRKRSQRWQIKTVDENSINLPPRDVQWDWDYAADAISPTKQLGTLADIYRQNNDGRPPWEFDKGNAGADGNDSDDDTIATGQPWDV